jgi:Bacterial type II and III secretion system protein
MSMRMVTPGLIATLLLTAWVRPVVAAEPPQPSHRLVQVVYPVADLVIPIDGKPITMKVAGPPDARPVAFAPGASHDEPAGAATNSPCVGVEGPRPGQTTEDQLIKLITNTVAANSWQATGGRGTITYQPQGMGLVVCQTPEVQEQVADLLAALHRLQDLEVAVEVRLLSLSDPFFERVGVDFSDLRIQRVNGVERTVPASHPPLDATLQAGLADGFSKPMLLNERQVFQLLEATQLDPNTNVMQAPKLTMFNGQSAIFDLPSSEEMSTRFKMSVQPVVSADRHSVRLQLKASMTNHEVATTVTLGDGATLVVGGWKYLSESRADMDPPVLSKIPYLSRLFSNVAYGRKTQNVVLLVTPRVIINEEEEQVLPPAVACPRQETSTTAPCPKAVAPPLTVLDNLKKLEDAREAYGKAERALRAGHTQRATHAFNRIQQLCPGSNIGEMAQARLKELRAVATADVAAEEQENTGPVPQDTRGEEVARLLKQYRKACAAGRLAEARRLAHRALALDPTCFSK